MRYIQHSVRLSPAVNLALLKLAEQRGVSSYSLLCRCVEVGLADMTRPREQSELAMLADSQAALAARLDWLSAITDRALFVASVAYAYARHAALKSERDPQALDTSITSAALAAYERQRAQAQEKMS